MLATHSPVTPVTPPKTVQPAEPMTSSSCRVALMTAPETGAVSIIQLSGDIRPVLKCITGHDTWPVGTLRLSNLADIDEGLVSIPTEHCAQLMPHGGLRIRQRLLTALEKAGAVHDPDLSPEVLFPEARNAIEAAALKLISTAASPLAIDLLLQQPERWGDCDSWTAEDDARSRRLNRLLTPPGIVMIGPPNIGKSSLLNMLTGRDVAIAMDEPGTTRDYVSALIELGGIVVRWHDTPGQRTSDDIIEMDALSRTEQLIETADMLILARDATSAWIETDREPDLRLSLRSDLGLCRDADVCVSAHTGEGLIELVECVREHLVPASDLGSTRPWRFPGLEHQTPNID